MTDSELDSITERIFDGGLTVEHVVHLAVQVGATEVLPDWLEEWLDDRPVQNAVAAKLGITAEQLNERFEEAARYVKPRHYAVAEVWNDISQNASGWLVEVSAPKYEWNDDESGATINAGWRTHFTCYGDTYDEALEAALNLAENHVAAPSKQDPALA